MIQWSDNLSVNNKDIDDQHKKFLEIVNDLLHAMRKKQSKQIQSEIIDKLIGYAFYHFSKEERYFTQAEYPGAEQHKNEHEIFVDKIIKFKSDNKRGKITLSIDMINFMNDWWINHIKHSDAKYKPYIDKLNK